MIEKLKTLILAFLIYTSINLTNQIWIEFPKEVFSPPQEAENFTYNYKMIDMISPNKYIVNFGVENNNHTLFYDESRHSLWTEAKKGLKEILERPNISLESLSKEEFSDYDRKRSISFEFPEQLNTYILAKALEVKSPNEIIDRIENVENIYIYLGSEEPFFVFANSKERYKIQDKTYIKSLEELEDRNWDFISKFEERLNEKVISNQLEDIYNLENLKNQVVSIDKAIQQQIDRKPAFPSRDLANFGFQEEKRYNYYYSMKDLVDTDWDIYLPYEMNNMLPKIYVKNAIRDLDEEEKKELAEKFLDEDIDYIREIVENNGSTIYISDQKTLKLDINGSLEYFNPLKENIKQRNLYESMKGAANFLSEIIGVPEGMYLSNIEEIIDPNGSQGYSLTFKYRIRGIPVILGNVELEDFVKIDIFNNHVKSYSQFMRKDMEKPLNLEGIQSEREMLTSFTVIDKNYELLFQDNIEEDLEKIDGNKVDQLLKSIRDITLAYFDPCLKDIDEELIQVWVIRTEVGLYVFDVFTGNLIEREIF